MRYILSCWRYIVITEVCVLTLTAVDFFNQAHQSSGIEAKLKGAGVQYSTVAPIIPTHPCYCCSVHGVLLHPSVLREWILEVREVKSEMKICFTHFENEK